MCNGTYFTFGISLLGYRKRAEDLVSGPSEHTVDSRAHLELITTISFIAVNDHNANS